MAELSAIQSSRDGQCLPYTPERFFNAGDCSSQTAFHNHALDAILTATSHQEIIYKDVPPAWGESVVTFLDEKAENTNAKLDNAIYICFSFTDFLDQEALQLSYKNLLG